jgi:putative ABC transport system permease protein
MLAGQVREIGVMKAIGARTGQLAAMYVALALVLGAVATGIAVPVAWMLGARYGALKAELLNFDLAGTSLPWWVIAVQVAAGLLLPLGAAALPVTRGCRITVSAALRDLGIVGDGAASAGLLLRVGGLSRPILLSLRNAFRRRQRMVLTLLTLATGGAVFLGARNLKAAIVDSVDLLFAPQRYDLQIRFAQPHDTARIAAEIMNSPGVTGGEAWGVARAAVLYEDGSAGNAFPIMGTPVDSRFLELRPRAGRWLRADDRAAIVVNAGLLRDDPSVAVGTEVRLLISGLAVSFTVVGVVDGLPSPVEFAPREAIAELQGSPSTDLAVVSLEAATTTGKAVAIQRLRADLAARGLPVAASQLAQESRRVMEDHLLMVAEFLGAMAWLMIVVGGLGLASTMSLSVLERTREVGVLRAIGARHGAILAMVQTEGLVIAVLSWMIALPLSVPMSLVLSRTFGRVMLPVPDRLVPEGAGVAMWLALVLGVSLVACAWPARRAMRITTAAALAYE